MSTNLLQVGMAADGEAVDALEDGYRELGLCQTPDRSDERLKGQ
jgi:hypothetical protein